MQVLSSLRGHKQANINVRLGTHQLTNVQQLALLSVTITSDLSWSSHSRLIRAKISHRLGAIRRFGRCLNAKTRLLAYNAFVRPHLSYCLPVWGNTNAVAARELDNVLIRCLRTFTGSRMYSTFSRDAFNSYKICDFTTQVFINNVLTLFTQFHLPAERRVFNPVVLTSYHTRASSRNKLLLTNINRTADRYCFNSSAPAQWNTLPNIVTATTNINIFKNKLTAFYS